MCTYSKDRSLQQPGIHLNACEAKIVHFNNECFEQEKRNLSFCVFFHKQKCYGHYCQVFPCSALLLLVLLTDCTSAFLLLPICQSEMTVALCQTSYTSDGNQFTFHLQLIIFSFLCCSQDEPVHSSHFLLEYTYLLHASELQGLTNNLWNFT